MKKFNRNILLFLFVMLFLVCGIRGEYIKSLKEESFKLRTGIYYGNPDSISSFINKVDNLTTADLRYHDEMLDLESVKKNLLGTRVVMTEDATVVKAASGSLFDPYQEANAAEITEKADEIQRIRMLAEVNGAKFLYCPAPGKGVFEAAPANIANYDRIYYKKIREELTARDIATLDFLEAFSTQGIEGKELFFRTDHHWKPAIGLAACQAICSELRDRYGFDVQEDLICIENYDVNTYKDWFLGSYGKKAGRLFTWEGAEDFDVIAPRFRTDFTETVSGREEARTGSFSDTMIYQEKLEKNPYHINNYAAYSGGDFHLQVIQNNLQPERAKILVIRDSFACVVTPFLALQAGELHVVDARNEEFVTGEAVNLETYIKETKPDYVLVLKAF